MRAARSVAAARATLGHAAICIDHRLAVADGHRVRQCRRFQEAQLRNDAAAAHRAVDSATTKRDIIEILQVMIISTGRSELPPVKGAAGYVGTPPNSKKSQRRVDPNSGRKSRADRAAARGNDFFEGDYDKDDVLVDGRPKTGPTYTYKDVC